MSGIEYVEIRHKDSRELIGIVDTAKSIIWRTAYYGVGDFEVYAPCDHENNSLLNVGNYVTRFDAKEIGIIERKQIIYNDQDGRMIIAAGRFAKSILDRRIIYSMSGNSVSPTILRGNVEAAARRLVTENAISCAFDSGRNIPALVLGAEAGIPSVIVDENGAAGEKQVTHDNLLEYTDALLNEYEMGAYCTLDESKKIAYTVFKGADRSVGNAEGNEPVIFSQDFDNLLSSQYEYDMSIVKNTALIGGEGEGTERFSSIFKDDAISGLDRREMFVDSSSSSKNYKDENGEDQTLSDTEYDQQLKSLGKQTVAENAIVETFNGEIDITNGSFKFGVDFFLGDLVAIQDNEIDLLINARIIEIMEVQDDNGYQLTATYGK